MSRLLFAAARGARVQMLYDKWHTSPLYAALGNPQCESRIHPDDEHLQYGPISLALREFAELGHQELIPMGFSTFKLDFYLSDWLAYDRCNDELHRSLFLLILAEALADEGL